MAFLSRTFAPAGLDAELKNRSWLHALARFSVIESRGFVWNATAGNLPLPSEDDRLYVHALVAGRAVLLGSGAVLAPGDALVARSYRDTFGAHALAFDGAHRALAFRLDERLLEGRPQGVVRLGREALEALVSRLSTSTCERSAERDFVSALELLRAAGLPVARDAGVELSRRSRIERHDQDVARGLSRALTVVQRPMLIDVTESSPAQSERHVRRLLQGFLERFAMPFAGWRELRQSFSLTTAALSMSVPGVTTEAVSQLTGFSSPAALCHAMQRAGLRAPQQIARSALELSRSI